MMENIPAAIGIAFGLTVVLMVLALYKTARLSLPWKIIIILWLILQAVLGKIGFYTALDTKPPRFPLLVIPPMLLIGVLFLTRRGRVYINSLDPGALTLLHLVRIPVELILFWLFVNRAVPRVLTFEGRNFDLLAGLTAPLIYYFGFWKRKMGRNWILVWNLLCLGLLTNVVVRAVGLVIAGTPIAMVYFPFVWLPCFLVPVVLWAHLSVILRRQTRSHPSGDRSLPSPA